MGLLWRTEERPVSNYRSALSRTMKTTQRLSEEKFELYDEQIKEMVRGAVVEPSVPLSDDHVSKPVCSEQGAQNAVSSPIGSSVPPFNKTLPEHKSGPDGIPNGLLIRVYRWMHFFHEAH